MPSPFPGMDPYLEMHWGDVHTRLITYGSDQLHDQLPRDLKVRVEEHVSVQTPEGRVTGFYPDIRVIEKPSVSREPVAVPSGTAIAEPLIVPTEIESETLRSIRIIDSRTGNRVVTAIEILSLTNKVSEGGRTNYRRKQRDLLDGHVNLVEIDLLREGEYMLATAAFALPDSHRSPYRISVVRANRRDQAEYYSISLRDPLPTFRIPLRPTDEDVFLDLQALLTRAYDNGGYDDLDYSKAPVPPLTGDDAAWADGLLRGKGLR